MFVYNQDSSWALPLLRSCKLLKLSLHMMCPLSVSSICKEVNVKHLFNINGIVVIYLASYSIYSTFFNELVR